MAKYLGVSSSVTRRLPRYYRFLGELMNNGVERISSREFAEIIGLTASQIRQDLNCFGGFGQQGYGYNVAILHREVGRILGVDKRLPAILIGAGNLGLAIANHMSFEIKGFDLLGIFDTNPKVIGQDVRGNKVLDVAGLVEFCEKHKPKAAFLCIPKAAAGEVAETLVELGVVGFWNFSHFDLSIAHKGKIAVENVHLGDSLMTLSYRVNQLLD